MILPFSSSSKPKGDMPNVSDIILFNSIKEPFSAISRTNGRLLRSDYEPLMSPLRTMFIMTLVPWLCYPLSAINLYGYLRCLYTFQLPKSLTQKDTYDMDAPKEYAVMRRNYDARRKKMVETYVAPDEDKIQYALSVVKDSRNEYIDDPATPNTAYLVQERLTLKYESIFASEDTAWGIISDACRFLFPAMMGYAFHPAAQRLKVDMLLVFQRRLRWNEVRHPVSNFFRTVKEYEEVKHRVNRVSPIPKDARPWHYKL